MRRGRRAPRSCRCSIGVAACTGPRPICAGSSPAHSLSTIVPSTGKLVLRHRRLRREHQPCRAVGDLRAVAGGDVAVLAIEKRLQLGQVFRRRIFAHAVVGGVKLAVAVVQRDDLADRSARPFARRGRGGGSPPRSASISRRVMPKRKARFSAVCPISSPTIGSVSPFMIPMMGVSIAAGLSFRNAPAFSPERPSPR